MTLTVATDSYISVADADTYFGARLYATTWTGAASTDKEKALRMAAKALDRESYVGIISDPNQVQAWPRTGGADLEGRIIDAAAIPQAIIDAQCELALRYLIEDPTDDSGTLGVRSINAGGVAISYDGRAPQRRLPDMVLTLIRSLLTPTGAAGASSAPLVR